MKIIMGESRSSLEAHAKKVLLALDREEERHPHRSNVQPRGVATYSARYPIVCDDCGDTFWANDPYASHPKCRRGRGDVGF